MAISVPFRESSQFVHNNLLLLRGCEVASVLDEAEAGVECDVGVNGVAGAPAHLVPVIHEGTAKIPAHALIQAMVEVFGLILRIRGCRRARGISMVHEGAAGDVAHERAIVVNMAHKLAGKRRQVLANGVLPRVLLGVVRPLPRLRLFRPPCGHNCKIVSLRLVQLVELCDGEFALLVGPRFWQQFFRERTETCLPAARVRISCNNILANLQRQSAGLYSAHVLPLKPEYVVHILVSSRSFFYILLSLLNLLRKAGIV